MGRANVLLFVTSERAAVYLPRGRKSQIIARPRDAGKDVAEEIDALLSALPLKPAKVWLLSTELWTGSIGLAHELVRRVEKRQLPQMIGFEVEPLSGIGAGQARTAIQPVGPADGEMQFWVTQIETSLFARIAENVAFHGGKLQAVMHPAGLPSDFGALSQSAQQVRLEVWNDVSVFVARNGKKFQPTFLADGPALLADAGRLAEFRAGAAAQPLSILADSAAAGSVTADQLLRVVSLEDDATLKAYLQSWSSVLAGKADVPSIAPQRPPISARTRRSIGGGLAAAALLGCVGHYHITKFRNQNSLVDIKQEIAELTAPITAAKAEKKKLTELEKSHQDAQAKQAALAEKIVNYREVIAGQRERIPLLLKSLSNSSDKHLLIQNIECDGSELRIVGRCLDPRQAKTLAIALAEDLEKTGLVVELPTTEALNLRPDGGPHSFELILHDSRG